ncbi:hypothetical protein LTS00_018085 [Friedmanniomyces endolithicus]|nr:hypothetical protein LTS00_018085 [Friedmanniomyces endolithicus]
MKTSWPQETVWPLEHRRHATRLTKYLRDTLNSIDRSQNQSVPVDLVRSIINGTISLIAKFQRIPNLSTNHENLQKMQTETRTAEKEPTQALSKIREDMKSNTSTADRSIAAIEEVKTLVREAAERGKTAAGMLRDIKNKGPQLGGSTALSYVAVAASGTIAPNIHNRQSVQTTSTQTQREVTVNIRNRLTIQSLRAMNPRNLIAHVERAIQSSGNEHIMNVEVMSSNQLKSGDLSIRTISNSEAQTLRSHADDWAHRIGAGAAVRKPTYVVLAQGIRTSTMDMDKFEEVRDNILQDNRPFRAHVAKDVVALHYVHYPCKTSSQC